MNEGKVHSGYYELLLEVSDLQGKAAVNNLTVTVCDCLDPRRPNCLTRKATRLTIRGGLLAIVFFSMVLVAGGISNGNNISLFFKETFHKIH